MQVLHDGDGIAAPPEGTVVTIGAYDGVHLGHQAVIREVRQLAAGRGVASAVVTFDRHPAMVVRPESAPKLLTDLEQRLELLAATGVDYTLVLHFDEIRAHERAEDFVTEVLTGRLNARAVVVGEDFHFGHERRGNVELLRAMGADQGFTVIGMALVARRGAEEPVSSTAIRRALAAGNLEVAQAMLGRPYEVRGVVRPGDKRGGPLLGFPTANLAVPGDILLPVQGIYAGQYVRAGGQIHPAAMNLGRRPSFYETAHATLLEAHLLDFDGDLEGERGAVRFIERLREEARFDDPEELKAQITADCEQTRAVLKRAGLLA